MAGKVACEIAEKKGNYYLKLLQCETDKINDLACFAEHELENGENLPEEITGKLRAASGKARLLVRQKLRQFEGLCQKNLSSSLGEAYPVNDDDLAGFWDLVSIQIDQVYDIFEELKRLKSNDWKAPPRAKKLNPARKTDAMKTNRC